MSRTHKTRPLMVKAVDRTDHSVGLTEVHDHRGGDCTLPEQPPTKLDDLQEQLYRGCYFDWEYTGTQLCGCRMCTMHDEFRADRRRDRQKSKRELRDLVKQPSLAE